MRGGTKTRFQLGAASITGEIQCAEQDRKLIHVLAIGKMTDLVYHARCDEDGNFCVRFLPSDDYLLYAQDYYAGWCRLPEVTVDKNTTDIGSHALVEGGTIAATVGEKMVADPTLELVVTDSSGIPIESPRGFGWTKRRFKVSGLWPGRWSVTVKKGDETLAEQVVTLRGTETVSCNPFEG